MQSLNGKINRDAIARLAQSIARAFTPKRV
jgi:hypothetical protein